MRGPLTTVLFLGVVLVSETGCGPTSDRYTEVSRHSGKCLSLSIGGGYNDGDPVQQWACSQYHMGLQKEWLFVPLQVTGNYYVKSIHSGKCLEVKLWTSGDLVNIRSGKTNGDIIQQSKCTGRANQIWTIVTTSAGSTFKSVHSGKCMQVRLGSTGGMQDGDAIEQWDCDANAKNQLWRAEITTPRPPNPPLDTAKGELCNVCNPANPECKPGARCIIMPSGQSICGRNCSSTAGCPAGYTCTRVAISGQTFFQCIPDKNTCPL